MGEDDNVIRGRFPPLPEESEDEEVEIEAEEHFIGGLLDKFREAARKGKIKQPMPDDETVHRHPSAGDTDE